MILRDKYGYPVETIFGKPITNLIRRILHTNIRRTLYGDAAFPSVTIASGAPPGVGPGYCEDSPFSINRAALATPSPQAPQCCCNASWLDLDRRDCPVHGPTTTQEQPAGSAPHFVPLTPEQIKANEKETDTLGAPSIASTSVTTPRKITWFCRICERDHTAYCPAVSEDNFLHLCDHCGQSFQGNQHECPSPSAPPLEQFFRNRFNAEWTPELERELLEIIAARNSGSPRKVGEDGAFAYVCPANCGCMWRDNGDFTMSLFGKNSESCSACEPLGLAELIPVYVARPSSVPVGEQK